MTFTLQIYFAGMLATLLLVSCKLVFSFGELKKEAELRFNLDDGETTALVSLFSSLVLLLFVLLWPLAIGFKIYRSVKGEQK